MTREIKKLSCPALLAAFFAFGASCSSSPETGITQGIGGTSTATGGGSTPTGGRTSGAGGATTATGGSVTGGSTASAGGTMAGTGGRSSEVGGTTFATSGSATSTGGNTAGTAGAGGTGGSRDAGAAGGTTSAGGTVNTGGAASTGGTSSTGGSRDAAVTDGASGSGGSRDAAVTDGASGSGGSRDAAVTDGATSTAGAAGTGGTSGAGGAGGKGGASGAGGAQLQPFKGIAGGACKVRTAMKVSWYYNWSPSENEACAAPNGVEYVPMIWGSGTAASIKTTVAGLASKGFKNLLGFNEPDNTTQSNITVASAIALLPAFDSPTIAIGTPATQANTTGQTWFTQYMADVAANTTLRADFIAIHWYGWNAGSCDAAASQLESYIKYAEGFPGNRPIWLTEWGCLNQSAPTAAGVIAFFKAALAVFAKHPRLARYAWYQWSPNCEVYNTDDTLTELGQVYAAAPSMK